MTPSEARKEWIRRLRSGSIKQLQGALAKSDGSRCCLGVACDIAAEHGIIGPAQMEPVVGEQIMHYMTKNGKECRCSMPHEVTEFFGIDVGDGSYNNPRHVPGQNSYFRSLAGDNDSGRLFPEIADIIESEPRGLLKKVS